MIKLVFRYALVVSLSVGYAMAQPSEPLVVDVDCDAGGNLAQAIREAEILAGRFGPAPCAGDLDDEGSDEGSDQDCGGEVWAPRPIEVNLSGTCEGNLRITTSDLTLRGAAGGASILGDADACPGPASACWTVEVVGALGVRFVNVSILQPSTRGALVGRHAGIYVGQSTIDSMGAGVRAEHSEFLIEESSVAGGILALSSRVTVSLSEVSGHSAGGMFQDLVASIAGSAVRVAVSRLEGGAVPGLCRALNDSRLDLDTNTFTDVNLSVAENSVSNIRGIDPLMEIDAWNFSKVVLDGRADSVHLGGFSRLIATGAGNTVGELNCADPSSDAFCPDGNVVQSNCAGCAGSGPASSPGRIAPPASSVPAPVSGGLGLSNRRNFGSGGAHEPN